MRKMLRGVLVPAGGAKVASVLLPLLLTVFVVVCPMTCVADQPWQTSWENFLDQLAPGGRLPDFSILNDRASDLAGQQVTWEGTMGQVTDVKTRVRIGMIPRPLTSNSGKTASADSVQVQLKSSEFEKWKGIPQGAIVKFRATLPTLPRQIYVFGVLGGVEGTPIVIFLAEEAEVLEVVKSTGTQPKTGQLDLQGKGHAPTKKSRQQLGEKNLEAGKTFMDENRKKEGVKELPNGIQYSVLKPGSGAKPKATDTVSVHYRGTLIDGSEFDSSDRSGKPVSFELNGVIKGLQEALAEMPEGSKWQVVIPPTLAYREQGAGDRIGPNETLVFDIELVALAPAQESKEPKESKDK